jgi:hypothetical protein
MTIYGVTSLLDPAEFGEPLARWAPADPSPSLIKRGR